MTDAQTSIDQARALLAKPDAQVRDATNAGVYVGEIVGEVPGHFIQKISPRLAVLHDKGQVSGVAVGQSGTLAYKGGRAEFAGKAKGQDRGLSR